MFMSVGWRCVVVYDMQSIIEGQNHGLEVDRARQGRRGMLSGR